MSDHDDPKQRIMRLFEQTEQKEKRASEKDEQLQIFQSGSGNIMAFGDVYVGHPKSNKGGGASQAKPGTKHISQLQRAKLKELVKRITLAREGTDLKPLKTATIWAELKRKCNVRSYHLIPIEDYDFAACHLITWLEQTEVYAQTCAGGSNGWRQLAQRSICLSLEYTGFGSEVRHHIHQTYGTTNPLHLKDDELGSVLKFVTDKTKEHSNQSTP